MLSSLYACYHRFTAIHHHIFYVFPEMSKRNINSRKSVSVRNLQTSRFIFSPSLLASIAYLKIQIKIFEQKSQ